MMKSVIVWKYITCVCYILQPVDAGTTHISKACFGSSGPYCVRHDINCSSTQKIAIYDAYYTDNTECPLVGLVSCTVKPDNVTEHGYHRFNNTELVPLYNNCSTQTQCVYPAPRRDAAFTFSVVKYQCIQKGDLLNISGGAANELSQVSLIHQWLPNSTIQTDNYTCTFKPDVTVTSISMYALDVRLGRGTPEKCLSQLSVIPGNAITTNNCSTVFQPFERLNITEELPTSLYFMDSPRSSSTLIWILINASDAFNVTCAPVTGAGSSTETTVSQQSTQNSSRKSTETPSKGSSRSTTNITSSVTTRNYNHTTTGSSRSTTDITSSVTTKSSTQTTTGSSRSTVTRDITSSVTTKSFTQATTESSTTAKNNNTVTTDSDTHIADDTSTGAIVGGVVATVLAVLVVTLVSVRLIRKSRTKSKEKEKTATFPLDAEPDMTYCLAGKIPQNNYHEIQDLNTQNSDYDYATADGMAPPPNAHTYFIIEPAGKQNDKQFSKASTTESDYDHIGDKTSPQTSDYDTTASVAQPAHKRGTIGEDDYGYNLFQKKTNPQTHQNDYDTAASATKAVAQMSRTGGNTDDDDYDHFLRATNHPETVSSPYDTASGMEDTSEYSVAGPMK